MEYRILVADDEELFRDIVAGYLEDSGYQVLQAGDGQQAIDTFMNEELDVALLDIDMPEKNGLEALKHIRGVSEDMPVIMLSGVGSMQDVIQAVKSGAWDYMTKPIEDMKVLEIAIERALERLSLIRENRRYRETLEDLVIERSKELYHKSEELEQTNDALEKENLQRKYTQKELNKNNQNLNALLSAIQNPIFMVNTKDYSIELKNENTEISAVNPDSNYCYHFLKGKNKPCHLNGDYCPVLEVMNSKKPVYFRDCDQENPQSNCELIHGFPVFSRNGKVSRVVVNLIDISDLRKAEEENKILQEQFLQAQKMESVGRLAGGIAHDFNNMLTTMIGYAELILMEEEGEFVYREEMETIVSTGRKAAQLTQQLLAFSRKQVLQWKVLNINSEVENIRKMITRLLGEDIKLKINLDPQAGNFKGDPSQLTQILMNLSINARDAMPNGGKLTIETGVLDQVNLENDFGAPVDKGPYVYMRVSDTGEGIPEDKLNEIFDPFFTTKESGKGTGLGLATVFGIVKQHNGGIYVESRIGQGTSFTVVFSSCEDDEATVLPERPHKSVKGKGTLLLVEDEVGIRTLLKSYLSKMGYQVVAFEKASQVLAECESADQEIDLLLSDVVMPDMDGPTLAEKLLEIMPSMKVLFMSGYTDDRLELFGPIAENSNFIRKPLELSLLTQKIGDILSE